MPIEQSRLFALVEASKDLFQATDAIFTRIKYSVENESEVDQLLLLRSLSMETIYDYMDNPNETGVVIAKESERVRLTRGYNKIRLAWLHKRKKHLQEDQESENNG